MSNQVMDFYNNDSIRPFEMSFGQNGKTVGTMRFNGDVMTFEGEADAAAAVFIDMIVKKQSQQWVDAQEKISTSEFVLNEFFQKTDWVQGDNRFDVIIPWGKHRADVLREYIDHVEAKCAALAAENAELKRNLEGTAEFCYSELPETTATDDFLAKQNIAEREKDISTLAEVRQLIAELSHHLQSAHDFIEHTEAFGHEASNGILCCGDARWDIDASKSTLFAAGIITKVGE